VVRRWVAACLLVPGLAAAQPYIHDRASALPKVDVPIFNNQLHYMKLDTGVDLRVVFVHGLGGRTLERAAADIAAEIGAGGSKGPARSVLALFETESARIRLEPAAGLDGYFPEAFTKYLGNEFATAYYASQSRTFTLRPFLRVMLTRSREAQVGIEFDPRVLKTIPRGLDPDARIPEKELARYRARATPAATYAAYLEWLVRPENDYVVDLFNAPSRVVLARFPVGSAHRQAAYIAEHGKAHTIVQRGDLAVMVFTGTPFVPPHFFEKEGDAWRIDIANEHINIQHHIGAPFAWSYRGTNDHYRRAFEDLFLAVGPYTRLIDGDNRPLPTAPTRR
jgi:hypothetical protein